MKNKVIADATLNIIATAIPVFVLQLFILPAIAKNTSASDYGVIITVLSLLNVVPSSLGVALNNVRLVGIENRKENNETSNYSLILTIMLIADSIIIGAFGFVYYDKTCVIDRVLLIATSLLWLMREYLLVAFRLKINYIAIFICNILQTIGYIAGYYLFSFLGYWELVYIAGYFISLIYIFCKTNIWKEPLKRDPFFPKIVGQTFFLIVATLLIRITTYADKMLIFPFLGGDKVSVYYTATLFGKVVSLTITPISGVMLSYLAKARNKNEGAFNITFRFGSLCCLAGYFICLLISKPVLTILYPQFVEEAMIYVPITTGTMVLTSLTTIVNPFVMKFFDMKWQVFINLVYATLYVAVSMILLFSWGLMGFCIGTIIAITAKLIAMLIIFKKCRARI